MKYPTRTSGLSEKRSRSATRFQAPSEQERPQVSEDDLIRWAFQNGHRVRFANGRVINPNRERKGP